MFAVACASSSDVEAAVTAAATAQKAWQTINGSYAVISRCYQGVVGLEKGRILRKAALLLDSRKDELAKIEALDSGRSIAETSVVDIQSAIDCLDYFAGVASNMSGQYMDLNGFASSALVVH